MDIDEIKFIKLNRMGFAGHICRLDATSSTYRLFTHRLVGNRTSGRPKLRLIFQNHTGTKLVEFGN